MTRRALLISRHEAAIVVAALMKAAPAKGNDAEAARSRQLVEKLAGILQFMAAPLFEPAAKVPTLFAGALQPLQKSQRVSTVRLCPSPFAFSAFAHRCESSGRSASGATQRNWQE